MSLYFTKEHEWIRVDGDVATVGISDHAQEALGDIVFAEAPEAGKQLTKGQEAAVVESVKAASDVYSPVGGEVIEGNAAIGPNCCTRTEEDDDDGSHTEGNGRTVTNETSVGRTGHLISPIPSASRVSQGRRGRLPWSDLSEQDCGESQRCRRSRFGASAACAGHADDEDHVGP